ncbi:TIGR04084 family radical SAM/SPASM domain-containing protein [Methanimicrococcus sp. OttesenSCG-928-J09]|nr:TIGR04084 family radical SAM/SPASM domain-containing protein [Methanimicrococcus sp. OttesenSCG-928-J09]
MVNFFVTLTMACDLECRYCYGEVCDCFDDFDDGIAVDYDVPENISYETSALAEFISKDKDAVVIFYGGEPLLEIEKMKEMMDMLPAKTFLLHTNATKLDLVPAEYLQRLHTISISIDGNRELTDYYRGDGVYDLIAKNANIAREKGFTGEVIARMTVQEETDIYDSVMHLFENPDFCFDSVHWQLNALFWRNDYQKRQTTFPEWANSSYNPGIQKLADEWVRRMKENGQVLHMYPFVNIMNSLLRNEKTHLRCGAAWTEYNVQTDGKLSPCPVMSGMSDYYAGDIYNGRPNQLRVIHVSGECLKCDILDICGGRCLYANATMKWGIEGFKEVCKTVRFLVNTLKEKQPEIEKLIENGKISLDDFSQGIEYNSCEIIP